MTDQRCATCQWWHAYGGMGDSGLCTYWIDDRFPWFVCEHWEEK